MPRYRAVLEWDSDEPMDEELTDAVTAGLWVSVDDPSNAEGDGLHWSGSNIACSIIPVPESNDLRTAINALRRRHHVSPDCWYTCPQAGPETDDDERCCDSSRDGDPCDCGAAKHNEQIDVILAMLEGHPVHELTDEFTATLGKHFPAGYEGLHFAVADLLDAVARYEARNAIERARS